MPYYATLSNSFILEFKKGLSEFDINEYKKMANIVTEGVVVDSIMAPVMNPELYTRYINKSVDELNGVVSMSYELDEFFSSIYKSVALNDKNITIPLLSDDDIEKIRPDYFKTVAADFSINMKKILDGSLSESDIRKKFISGDYFNKLRKQLVKTDITFTSDIKELMSLDSPAMVKIDNTFIQNNTISFLRAFPQNVKDLTVIATNVKGAINSSYADIREVINDMNDRQSAGKILSDKIRLVNFYKYNFIRGYLTLCSYVCAMLIRKISCYTYNMMSYSTLQNTIYNYFPEGNLVLHESIMDGKLDDIDDTTLLNSIIHNDLNVVVPHVQATIGKKKMEIANLMARKYQYKLTYMQDVDSTKYPYDVYPYVAVNKTIHDIANNLHTFEVNVKNPDLTVDEIIEKSDLSETFLTKYRDILSKVTEISYYTSQFDIELNKNGEIFLALFNDISHYEKNVKIISDNIHRCYMYLESLVELYSTNTNNVDDATFNELNSFINQTMKNYKDYILQLTKRLLDRLDNLTDTLDDIDMTSDNSNIEQFVPYDYYLDAMKESYTDIELMECEIFESMMKEYHSMREKKERGVTIVYEEVTEAPAGNNAKSSVSVGHQSPTENQNASQANSTSASNASNSSGSNERRETLIQKFLNWIEEKLTQFKNNILKITKTNNTWLASVKADLLGLNTENIAITVAKYENVTEEKILRQITSATTKINGINPSNLPPELKGKRSQAELYVFGEIPQKLANEDSFGGRLRHFFMYGKTEKRSLVTYSGNDAKQKIENMIEFCENYSKVSNNIANKLTELTNAAADKQTEIINSLGQKKVQESVILEAEAGTASQNNKVLNTSSDNNDKINTSNIVTSITRDYAAAVLTLMEKKYLDYIAVLDKLVPKDKTSDTPATPQNNDAQDSDTK